MAKLLYCRFCGKVVSFYDKTCPECKRENFPLKSKQDRAYYEKKSLEKYGVPTLYDKIFKDEEFNFNNNYQPNTISSYNKYPQNEYSKPSQPTQEKNVPHCPICNSTKISKISSLNRAAHGYAFGLFSKTARSQFVCKNCGYKF